MLKFTIDHIMLDPPAVYVDWAITQEGEHIGNKLSGRATLWCHDTHGLLDAVERLQTVCRDAAQATLRDYVFGVQDPPPG